MSEAVPADAVRCPICLKLECDRHSLAQQQAALQQCDLAASTGLTEAEAQTMLQRGEKIQPGGRHPKGAPVGPHARVPVSLTEGVGRIDGVITKRGAARFGRG